MLKFQVKVYEDGSLLDAKGTKKKFDALTKKMRQDSYINALKNLAKSEKNDILSNALEFYLKNKYLTPKLAFVVLWRLSHHKIDHHASFFKVN